MADIRISLNGKESLYKIVSLTNNTIFISPVEAPINSDDVSALVKNDMGEWIVLGSSEPYVIEFLKELPSTTIPVKQFQSRIPGKSGVVRSVIPGKRIYPIEPKRASGLAFGDAREGMMGTSSGFRKPGEYARFSGGFAKSSRDEQMEEVD